MKRAKTKTRRRMEMGDHAAGVTDGPSICQGVREGNQEGKIDETIRLYVEMFLHLKK